MNRYDEIQATARNIAEATFEDPERRNRLADELIKLVTLVINAVGKSVAVDGERYMNEADDDEAERHDGWLRYVVGEDMQSGSDRLVKECSNPEVDLERYTNPVWTAGEFWSRQARSWVLTRETLREVDTLLDEDGIYAKGYYVNNPDAPGTKVDGLKFGNGVVKDVARYGDTITRSDTGRWSVVKAGHADHYCTCPGEVRNSSAHGRGCPFEEAKPGRCDQNAGHELPHTG